MDLTNRVLVLGGALLWIFVILVIILLAWGAPDESIVRLTDLAGYLEDHNETTVKLIMTFGGLILILLAVIVIIFEVAPPATRSMRVEKVGGGEARISTEEIAHVLEEKLRELPDVNQVQASVLARGRKAEVSLDLHVGLEADLSATAEEACRRARQLFEEQIGVTLARSPQARLHYRELRVARPKEASTSPPGEAAAPSASQEPRLAGRRIREWLPPEPTGAEATEPTPAENPPSSRQSADETAQTSEEDRPADA